MYFGKIVEHFKVITNVNLSKDEKHLFVSGLLKNNELNTLRVTFNHKEVAKEVQRKVQMFIGIEG